MKLKFMRGLVAALSLAAGGAVQALPVTFDLSSANSAITHGILCTGNCSVSVTMNPLLDSLSATLAAGEVWEFDFFTLSYTGAGIGGGSISANLGFDAPMDAPDALGSGRTSLALYAPGVAQGYLIWDQQPGLFTLSDGTRYSVELQNTPDIPLFSSSVGVGARLTLLSEPTDPVVGVPEPGMLGLFGLGLLGIGAARRRRQLAR